MKYKYNDELNKLIENEDNFVFFKDLALKHGLSDPKFVKEMLDEVLSFIEGKNLNKVKGWSYYFLAWYYVDIFEYKKAVENYLYSHDVFENIDYKLGIIYACSGIGGVYCQMGQFKLANEWGLKGISLSEQIKNDEPVATLLLNTSINFNHMRLFEKAKEILNTIKMLNLDVNEKFSVEGLVLFNLANALTEINIGDPLKAFDYIEEASTIESNSGLFIATSEIYKLKGMAYIKLKEYDKAEKEFIKSYDFANQQNYIYDKCLIMIEKSKLDIILGRNHEAIQKLNELIEIGKLGNLEWVLRDAYYSLYNIHKKVNKYEESLFYLEKYILIDDGMYDYEQNQMLAKMNIKHTQREVDLYKLLYDKTELLSSIGQKIISNLDIKSITEIISMEIDKLIQCDIFGIAVYNKNKKEAVYNLMKKGTVSNIATAFKLDDKSIFGSYCIKNKADIIIGNVLKQYGKYTESYPTYLQDDNDLQMSLIYTPLIINDNVVGLITVQSSNENQFNNNDLNTLKIIGNYSAIAIQNAINYKKIEDIATYDYMTGFLTRFEIIRLGEIIYEKYKENKKSFSVIMIDIDNFKLINDTYGHSCGDIAIKMITSLIAKCIRTSDYIGRYGGDEFLLICPEADQEEAIMVSERIRKTISNKQYELGGDNIKVKITLSLGVYEFGKEDLSFLDGVKVADKYLYKSKKGFKNKVSYKEHLKI